MSNINKNKKFHFIYKTSDVTSGKYYIGMHSTSNINDGYLGSGKRLRYSIRKYGKENFKLEILEFLPDRKLLVEREREIINVDMINDPNCLNLQTGGISGFDYINSLRNNNPEYDKKWRELQIEKLKNAHKQGKIKYDTFTGKQHTEESKFKMSNTKKGPGIGVNNSQFGTCWITKNGDNKKIRITDLQTHINVGWVKGRK